jgi:hypothetical protein
MAIFYYNGTGAQGTGNGSTAANASASSSSAISALSSGNSVEVTAGTFTLSAAEANGKSISGAGNVAVTAISSTLNANLSGIAVSGTKTGAFNSSGMFTGNLGLLDITISSGAVLSAVDSKLLGDISAGPSFTGSLAVTNSLSAPGTLRTIASRTSGSIDVSAVTSMTGALANFNWVYGSSKFTGLGNETLTLNDTSVVAADLITIDGETSAAINANSVTSISGTASDLATALTASGITTATGVAVTVSAGSAAATDLNSIDTNTTTVVDATAVTTITGLVADVKTAIASAGITGLGNEAVTLTDTSLGASDLITLDGQTSG